MFTPVYCDAELHVPLTFGSFFLFTFENNAQRENVIGLWCSSTRMNCWSNAVLLQYLPMWFLIAKVYSDTSWERPLLSFSSFFPTMQTFLSFTNQLLFLNSNHWPEPTSHFGAIGVPSWKWWETSIVWHFSSPVHNEKQRQLLVSGLWVFSEENSFLLKHVLPCLTVVGLDLE